MLIFSVATAVGGELSKQNQVWYEQVSDAPEEVISYFENQIDRPGNDRYQVEKFLLLCEAKLALTLPQDALVYADKGLELSDPYEQYPWLYHHLLMCKADVLTLKYQLKQSMLLVNTVILWAEQHKDIPMLIEGLHLRGLNYAEIDMMADSMKDAQRAYQLASKQGDEVRKSEMAADIALIYRDQEKFDKAIEYHKQRINFLKQEDKKLMMSIALFELGRTQIFAKRYQQAKQPIAQSKALAEAIGDQQGVGYALKIEAKLQAQTGNNEQAAATLKQAIEIFQKAENDYMLMESAYDLVNVYINLGALDKAEAQLKQVKLLETEETPEKIKISNQKLKAKLLNLAGKTQQSYEALLEAFDAQDKLRERQFSQQTAIIQQQYETKVQEKERQLLTQQNLSQQQKIIAQQEKNKLQTLLLIAFSATTLLLLLIIYRAYRYRKKLEHIANHDRLTGLLNRQTGFQQIKTRYSAAARVYIAMIDLDHFKKINDQFGHAIGDKVLKEFAKCCQQTLQDEAISIRLGGEEFLIAFDESNITKVKQIIRQLRNDCTEKILLPNQKMKVSFSAGIGQWKPDDPLSKAIEQADMAMYAAKSQGRNRIITH